jgi:F0F1-type ATP synthase membrane subunit c/vacuolar-type H+-ATPase subunit K
VRPVQAEVDTSAIGPSAVYLAEAVLLAVIGRKAVSVVARKRAAEPRTFVVGFR